MPLTNWEVLQGMRYVYKGMPIMTQNKNSFIKMRTNCSLDLLNIRTIQRDMLIKATDQMVLENQKVNAILDQIIETVLESDTDHPDVKKIKEIITDER